MNEGSNGLEIKTQYFFDGFWQPCKIVDFFNLSHNNSLMYMIEFKGNLFSVFEKEVRFIKNNEQLFMPLKPQNLGSSVVFQ